MHFRRHLLDELRGRVELFSHGTHTDGEAKSFHNFQGRGVTNNADMNDYWLALMNMDTDTLFFIMVSVYEYIKQLKIQQSCLF